MHGVATCFNVDMSFLDNSKYLSTQASAAPAMTYSHPLTGFAGFEEDDGWNGVAMFLFLVLDFVGVCGGGLTSLSAICAESGCFVRCIW